MASSVAGKAKSSRSPRISASSAEKSIASPTTASSETAIRTTSGGHALLARSNSPDACPGGRVINIRVWAARRIATDRFNIQKRVDRVGSASGFSSPHGELELRDIGQQDRNGSGRAVIRAGETDLPSASRYRRGRDSLTSARRKTRSLRQGCQRRSIGKAIRCRAKEVDRLGKQTSFA